MSAYLYLRKKIVKIKVRDRNSSYCRNKRIYSATMFVFS